MAENKNLTSTNWWGESRQGDYVNATRINDTSQIRKNQSYKQRCRIN